MFFDAVVDDDMKPLFNGTPAETLEWVQTHMVFAPDLRVCIGKSMSLVTFGEYLLHCASFPVKVTTIDPATREEVSSYVLQPGESTPVQPVEHPKWVI
jgi:hypothetical protein